MGGSDFVWRQAAARAVRRHRIVISSPSVGVGSSMVDGKKLTSRHSRIVQAPVEG
jgi:hypothetical protein